MSFIKVPRIVISSHKGGAGKTLLSLALIALLRERGLKVSPFKKGPDYIDAGWLGKVAGQPCRNLDLFLFDEKTNLQIFYAGSKDSDIAIIEGNRGLYDGVDVEGSCSTAGLARLLRAPILLVLDCTKVTRSIAALLKGFIEFEKDINIVGVFLNHIVRSRHESLIRSAIERYVGIPVLGVIPRLRRQLPERYLGLITHFEEEDLAFVEELKENLKTNADIDRVLEFARQSPLILHRDEEEIIPCCSGIRIGVFWDPAFQFYYPENLEMLESLGGELCYIDSMRDHSLPSGVSGLYIGGGFPELYAESLAQNKGLREDVRHFAESGMPIYAECGGLMYLGRYVEYGEKKFPLAGILPISFRVDKRPHGHGYVIARVVEDNPYFQKGEIVKGHEFHYSYPSEFELREEVKVVFSLEKGQGLGNNRDGIIYRNVFASYTHIHVFSVKYWAERFLRMSEDFSRFKKTLEGGVRCSRSR